MKQNSLQIQIYFEIHIICNFDLTNIKPMKFFFLQSKLNKSLYFHR